MFKKVHIGYKLFNRKCVCILIERWTESNIMQFNIEKGVEVEIQRKQPKGNLDSFCLQANQGDSLESRIL